MTATALEHKRIHPFDVYVMLLDAKVTDVIKRGREKVTVEAEGHAPYSYWATVVEIDGVLYTDTATVEPQTDKGKDMLRESTRYGKMPTKMPKTTITYSHLEMQPPAQALANAKINAHIDILAAQHEPRPIIGRVVDVDFPERQPPWGIIFALLAGMVFGAAVTALVLLSPTQ